MPDNRSRRFDDDEATVESGRLRGRRDGDVLTWHAVPYAAPPVGELRLRAPRPPRPWPGVRDATTFRYAALSHPFSAPRGLARRQPQSEDCLTVNVCAPVDHSDAPRPVMVFFHGGGWFEGSSGWPLYDPRPLVRRGGVVLVTVNYRLNGLGFVDFSGYSTPQRTFETNVGLRDQLAALRWVRSNIAAFGGDPDNVTIFGESAGAGSVTTMLSMPAAAGLFHRAIAQSAPVDAALSPAFAAEIAERCVRNLGATAKTAAAVLDTVSGRAISAAALKLLIPLMREVPSRMIFGPVIDGDLVPENPVDVLAAGRGLPVPLIIGTNRDELFLHGRAPVLATSDARLDRLFTATNPEAREAVLAAYAGLPRAAAQCGTDLFFLRPSLAAIEGHRSVAPAYLYRFDYASPLLRRLGIGAFHGFDLVPLFGVHRRPIARALVAGDGAAIERVSTAMQGHWLHFARTGAPRPDWPAYTAPTRSTMLFDAVSRVADDPYAHIRPALLSYAGPYRDRTPMDRTG
ncbi:carboxylesterase/lipase family protein [Nocardia sp. NPDC127526]|uniref:carboxylesterase/lipase family protein n=1 Tax=Nocardia sp. NPDC127526 TaxID=3345393 RepID=UPI0036444337